MDSSAESRRIGVFGGTFDPPHFGHLVAAQEVGHRLRLERVLLVPARQNPLKAAVAGASVEQRVRMLELVAAHDARFAVSRADADRPGPSYSVDLLRRLQEEHPRAELLFVIGADALRELPDWREPAEILRRWRLATFVRPGKAVPNLPELEARLPAAAGRVEIVPIPGLDVSATEIRARVAAGLPIRYLLPDAVRLHIEREGLYRAQ